MFRLIFCSFLLTASITTGGAALAGDQTGNFAVHGAGLIDCATFLREKEEQSEAYVMIGGWIDGYMTAFNQLSERTYDITPYQSTEMLVTVIENHCLQFGDHRLFTVVTSMAEQLREDRLSQRSELITIRVDDKDTRLYKETIRRMQLQLQEQGHLKESATGRFDTPTLNAVKSYQESIDYVPTGFPDQATLWKLFAE